MEIALRVLEAIGRGWGPAEGAFVLSEGWKLDPDAAQRSAELSLGYEIPPLEERYPVVFAPAPPGTFPDEVYGERTPQEWELLLYDHRAACAGKEPLFRHGWKGQAGTRSHPVRDGAHI